ASEVGPVRITGMRANAHSPLQRQPCSALHGSLIARVSAARDIRRGDELHERGFVRPILQLAHVAIEVDHDLTRAYSHCSCSRSNSSARSIVTLSKRTSSR